MRTLKPTSHKLSDKRLEKIQRDKKVLKGIRLSYNAGIQDWYTKALTELVATLTYRVKKSVLKFFNTDVSKDYFEEEGKVAAMDSSITSQAKIINNKLQSIFDNLIHGYSNKFAEQMVLRSNKASKATLSKSMESLTGGITLNFEQTSPELKEIMSATVAENVALISTITGTYLDNVQKSILRSITTGQGLKELIPSVEENLNSFAGDTHRKAINVALDQTRKAYNNINRQRMEKIGQKKFEWVHSGGGQHPRQLHIEMNGNIYSFDDLPIIDKKKGERGIPGQAINCKCTMLPVIEFNEVPNDD